MPAVASGKVLVTGANGYVAVWVVRRLLEKGYSVRATVRAESKGTHLRKIFAEYGDKLEIVVVADITKPGAFDEAVKGVDAVEHTASPFHFNAKDPAEIVTPAVNGTLRALEAVLAHGTSVKRVVVTSSCAAVLSVLPEPHVFNESDWNDQSVDLINQQGADADQVVKYLASKTLAERAAWEFLEKNKGKINWDLVVINPPYVYGPAIHEVESPEALNESLNAWYRSVFKNLHEPAQASSIGYGFLADWIDVRDVADAHYLALQKEQAANQRIIISAGNWKWQDWINTARKFGVETSKGDDSYDPTVAVHMIQYDVSRAKAVLGINKYYSIEETTKDTIDDFKARGWIN
ncbi:NAD(P)-binding protein [Wolfiporia cocos MD-104 SS10]|uniref:NAD(P)-binding protein n=1 Tax=Wolfiporia cocos (strain MD-104) TaxID=742152 RepID=A0A2H3K281_WOLCO|nr:NAD(P)-binding protein [Wolfiporia cocos MD-104 SS10]